MNQAGYGFVIAAAPAADGRISMVASQCVRGVDIEQNYKDDDIVVRGGLWRGQASSRQSEDTKIVASLAARHGHQGPQQVTHLNVKGGYADAWRRLFDIWVPPQFTDETRTQILTHYIFGY